MKTKRMLLLFLILCFILTGCSQITAKTSKDINSTGGQDTAKTSKDAVSGMKGRYIEKNIALPENINSSSSLMLTKRNDMPFLLEAKENPFILNCYQLEQDGTWSEATPAWLKGISLPKGWSYRPSFMEDVKGNQYLFFSELKDNFLIGHLLRSADGSNYEELYPEGWAEKDENGFYDNPAKAAILKDGSLAALFYNGDVILYDSEEYKIKHNITGERFSEEILLPIGDSLLISKADDNRKQLSIEKYDLTNMDQSTSFPYTSVLAGFNFCDKNENDDIYLCNSDGIHKLEKDTTVWNTVVDGTLTSLAMPTMWSNGFIAAKSDQFYVLYNTETTPFLMQYRFDATVDAQPSTSLTIYSLKDSSTIRQAAAIFQQQNPDIKVDFTTAMTEDEYAQADASALEDYIRSLNTKLLAGDGYDILVLDGLPAESFREKGILKDMSDLIKPMIDSGELAPNILSNYSSNDKLYSIPARFALNLIFGKTADTKQLTTLDTLAKYADSHKKTSLFGKMKPDNFIEKFSPYISEKILKPDGTIDRNNLISVLEDLYSIISNGGMTEEASEEVRSIWGLTEDTSLYFGPQKGFLDSIFDFGIIKHINGFYTSFENSFTPICELGINSESSNKELCYKFISLVVSEEIQKNDLYDGFPINTKALEDCSNADRSNYTMGISVASDNGNDEPLYLYAQTEEQIKDIISFCQKADQRLVGDDHITAAFKECTQELFVGNQTSDEAADAIIQKLKVYLSE